MMRVRCATCGKSMNRRPGQIKRSRNSFCNAQCQRRYRRTGNEVACCWCGQTIYKPLSRLHEHNFCSAACRNEWLRKLCVEEINVPGHSAGHKAPHLSALNRRRNPLSRIDPHSAIVSAQAYRHVSAQAIGRELHPHEVVHHINGNRSDNRPENLAVISRTEHRRLHMYLACGRFEESDHDEGGDESCQKSRP